VSNRSVTAGASIAAGVLWIVAWLHLLMAHGVTEVNEAKLVFGLTWLDSGRLIAPSLVLVGVAILILARAANRSPVTLAASAALVGVGMATIGAVLGFWTQPWGTYVGASRETGVAALGGAIVIIGSLLMAIGLVAFSAAAARSRILPAWLSIVVAVGALSAVPWLHEATLQGALFGVAWVLVGVALGTQRLPWRA
jgi:hypothetical protein